jgi:hypothetical protein
MKRDWDLLREQLLALEEDKDFHASCRMLWVRAAIRRPFRKDIQYSRSTIPPSSRCAGHATTHPPSPKWRSSG